MTRPANDPARDLAPDVLRGFALFGIALVNVAYFSTDPLLGATGAWLAGAGNTIAAFLVWTLAQGKFYLLFSFLFGYSSQYLVKGDPAQRPRWFARALALLAFGAIHVTLLWHGDILFGYGLLALPFAALMFRRDATLWRWAWGTYLVFAALLALLVFGLWAAERAGEPVDAMGGPTILVDVLQSGTYLASIPARIEVWATAFPSGMLLQGGFAFAMFLLGLIAARAHALRVGGPLRPRSLMAWGFGLGLPIQAFTAWVAIANELGGSYTETVAVGAIALNLTTAPLLSAGYIGAILALLERRPGWVTWLRYPGRMSLTTYLAQSAVLATLFGPWGLGLFQRLDYGVAVLVSAATWLALAGLARLVLGRFRQGPLEWVMSSWTKSWSRAWARYGQLERRCDSFPPGFRVCAGLRDACSAPEPRRLSMSLRTPSRIVGLALVLALGACAPGTPPVTLTISPSGPVEVRLDGSASFTVAPATVGIVWSVNGIPGGDMFVGTVSASGTYTAPYRLLYGDSVQVTATEGTRSVSATANLIAGGTMYLGDTTVHAYHDADLTDGNVAPDRSFTLQGVTGKLYDMVIVPELDLAFMNFDAAPRIHRVASISTADGVVTDFVTFSDGFLNSPSGIAYDAGRDLLYVLLNGALLVFEEASTAPDGATAARVVAGGNTGVFTVDIDGRLALDAAADRLFISDPDGEVAVYDTASTIDGNVAPDRVFSVASSTSFVWGLSYDAGRDELYVGNQSARVGVHVVANASTVTGNVTPSRSIGGPTNPLYEPSTVTYDARHDRLALVITAVEGYAVYDDASTVDGDVAPDRVVRGSLVPIGYPFGGVLDPTR